MSENEKKDMTSDKVFDDKRNVLSNEDNKILYRIRYGYIPSTSDESSDEYDSDEYKEFVGEYDEMKEDWKVRTRADAKRETRALAIAEAATDDEIFDESDAESADESDESDESDDEFDESDEDDYSRERIIAKNRITGKGTIIADMYKRAGVLPGAAFISTSVDESDDESSDESDAESSIDPEDPGEGYSYEDELREECDAQTTADCMSEQASTNSEAERIYNKHLEDAGYRRYIEISGRPKKFATDESSDESSDCRDY